MIVENRPMNCSMCGQGPWYGRESTYVDRPAQEIVTECTWVCGQCGSVFSRGETSRRPLTKEKQDEKK